MFESTSVATVTVVTGCYRENWAVTDRGLALDSRRSDTSFSPHHWEEIHFILLNIWSDLNDDVPAEHRSKGPIRLMLMKQSLMTNIVSVWEFSLMCRQRDEPEEL